MATVTQMIVDCSKAKDDPTRVQYVDVEDDRPPPLTPDEIDTNTLNKLLVEDGSVVRALAEGMLILLNRVEALEGVALVDQTTKAQFINWIKSKMRA